MYLVKRKYLVKGVCLVLLLVAIISGIFLSDFKEKSINEKNNSFTKATELINLLSDFQSLSSSFEKSINSGSFDSSEKEIYALCRLIENTLFRLELPSHNTLTWLNNFSEYVNSDTQETEKNTKYLSDIKGATGILVQICTNVNKKTDINALEAHFAIKDSKEYYKNQPKESEQQFSILQNQIKAKRSEISSYAKDLLKAPLIPSVFKGIFIFPDSVTYNTDNSYADIFPSDKTLNRMATAATSVNQQNTYFSLDEKADYYIKLHAPYALNCKIVYKEKVSDSLYFIFCPEYSINNKNIINYDEQIKLTINSKNGSLKAFDASLYLKNHKSNQPIDSEYKEPKSPDISSNNTVIDVKTVIKSNKYYTEYRILSHGGQKYYVLRSEANNDIILTSKEFLNFICK